jgi:tRNA-Thr(GGU) m(6)t(6)A37 methyltransferase TsaA
MNFEQALEDLDGFDRIWVIYWFHRNSGWRPKVLPPRGTDRKRGVFATRSPHRPNPLGLSLLRLIDIRGRRLRVADVDLLDGTPVLDIKPYLPSVEAFPDSRTGWLEENEAPRYRVTIAPLAIEQLEWLRDRHRIDLEPYMVDVLSRDPAPHPYRRIEAVPSGMVLAIKSWRVLFRVDGDLVSIEAIASGYPADVVAGADPESLHHGVAHGEFHRTWG